jgi:hypothetical protein
MLERREQEKELHVHAEQRRDGHRQRAVSAWSVPWANSVERRELREDYH